MSTDLFAYVMREVDKQMLDRALVEIGAPCAAPSDPRKWRGHVRIELRLAGAEGEPAGGFEGRFLAAGPDEPPRKQLQGRRAAGHYTLTQHAGDEENVVWTVALALAVAGEGFVDDPQASRPPSHKSILKRVEKWRKSLEKQVAKRSGSEKTTDGRQRGESARAYKERVWLRRAEVGEVATFVKQRLADALAKDDPAVIDWLCAHVPAKPALMEAFLDPCFRAQRTDVGERLAARFRPADLRAHLLEAAGWIGVAAVPYAQFVATLPACQGDPQLLADAARVASSKELRDWLQART